MFVCLAHQRQIIVPAHESAEGFSELLYNSLSLRAFEVHQVEKLRHEIRRRVQLITKTWHVMGRGLEQHGPTP